MPALGRRPSASHLRRSVVVIPSVFDLARDHLPAFDVLQRSSDGHRGVCRRLASVGGHAKRQFAGLDRQTPLDRLGEQGTNLHVDALGPDRRT
jgi:hypothetical protein